MRGLTFPAWIGEHYVSLAELLLTLGRSILSCSWEARVDEIAPHPRANRIEAIVPSQRIGTMELLHLVTPDVQVIDGELRCLRDAGDHEPWISIRAVDSTSWDVESSNEEILEIIRNAFPAAEQIR